MNTLCIKMSLNTQQQHVFDACTTGNSNIFCTGEGGTGKSWLLSKLVNTFRTDERYKDKTVAITASTGLAACSIGGTTLHSFAGVQIVEDNPKEMIKRARRGKSYGHWVDTDILVIDEISMISATFFDNLSQVGQDLRQSKEPFGGIRIIMFGDFLQLPPISKGNKKVKKVFESETWQRMSVKCFSLSDIIRQSDLTFKNVLSSLRVSDWSKDMDGYVKNLSRDLHYNDNIKPVQLFPLRANVDDYNNDKLNLINSQSHTYTSIDKGDKMMLKQCIAPRTLTLKMGAQVMVIRNLSPLVVNGSIGTITGFEYHNDTKTFLPIVTIVTDEGHTITTMTHQTWETIAPNGRTVIAKRIQIPLILAWATTIHKSQGQTISRLSVDLEGVFEYAQTYVALSRARDSENLQVKNFTRGKVRADPESVQFYKRLSDRISEDEDRGQNGVIVEKPRAAKVFIGFAD